MVYLKHASLLSILTEIIELFCLTIVVSYKVGLVFSFRDWIGTSYSVSSLRCSTSNDFQLIF